MHLTICYQTARLNPRIEWFYQSLLKQVKPEDKIKLVIVDRFAPARQWDYFLNAPFEVLTVSPKPCVWQGEHRLTKENWFAAANSRNTGLCLAHDGWIAYVDDLSVLVPYWLQCVRNAMADNYLVCGAYQKVKELVVENGYVKSFTYFDRGNDNRRGQVNQDVTLCSGDWLFGCSCAMPVEALLTIGGWLEVCDGLGSEDYCTGIVLNNAGFGFRYDRRMMTYESEEAHTEEPALKRTDKGLSPLDKSHAILRIAKSGQKFFDNQYAGGIRAERERVLSGEPFMIRKHPDRDWFDGALISSM
jgi:hypothetical protein